MYKTRYIFIRHAEAQKNIVDVTGGSGTTLTENGVQQAHETSLAVRKLMGDREYTLYSSPMLQAIETSEIIADDIGGKVNVSDDLAPSNMGVLSGMTVQQMKEIHPQEYEILVRWRKREIDVTELNIPGIMEPTVFWNQIMRFVNHNRREECIVAVCTRSIMVLIANYLDGHRPVEGGGYKHYEIENCSILAFDLDEKGYIVRVK